MTIQAAGGGAIPAQERVGVQDRVYQAARDRGDSLEAAQAILAKIMLLSGTSLAREAGKASRQAEGAAFLQEIRGWVGDRDLSAEEIAARVLSAEEAGAEELLERALGLDSAAFTQALENDREALTEQLDRAIRIASGNSNLQGLALQDLLHQRNVLMTLGDELIGLIKGLKTGLNERG